MLNPNGLSYSWKPNAVFLEDMPTPFDSNEDEFEDCIDPQMDGIDISSIPPLWFFDPEIESIGYIAIQQSQGH